MTRPLSNQIPSRLAPFLAQWDYIVDVLLERLAGLDDVEFLWRPARHVLTVRPANGGSRPDVQGLPPTGEVEPPRTLAWLLGHLGAGSYLRADYLVGDHKLADTDLTWPLAAREGIEFMTGGLRAWRGGLDHMTDEDLDTVGRSAYPGGLDPTLPLIEIVWWQNKDLLFHAGEIWYVRDLYAASR
jgi:DinB superfamily